jgi:hypothetical protein
VTEKLRRQPAESERLVGLKPLIVGPLVIGIRFLLAPGWTRRLAGLGGRRPRRLDKPSSGWAQYLDWPAARIGPAPAPR